MKYEDLYSCLLVNRLWCEVSVPILWIDIQSYNILIACLPNESKEILHKNGIVLSTFTSKPPLFNYVTFIKFLSINEVCEEIALQKDLNRIYLHVSYRWKSLKCLWIKLLLKELSFYSKNPLQKLPLTTYSGLIDCLRNLSEFNCIPNISYNSI